MNRTLPVLTLAAVWLGVSAFLQACGGSASSPSPASPSTPSPSTANPSPSPPPGNTSTSPAYTVSGVVTDAVSHAAIRGAIVEVLASDTTTLGTTDDRGAYAISNVFFGNYYRVRVSATGYDLREQVIYVIQNTRVDFKLRPPVSPSANYAGAWTGVYEITECRDLDVPGLTQFHLCPQASQSYQFTLTQIGTLVSGTYTMKSEFYMCACGGVYGDIPMSGSISPDGTLAITALGSGHGTVGATVELDLLLRSPSSTTLTGTGTIHLRFGTPDDRSIGSVVIRSGTRTQ